jgi:hypothetical protein
MRAAGYTHAQARDAVAAVQTSIGFGAPQQQAAAKGMIDTGTAYANMQDWLTTAARVSNRNQGALADVVGYGNAAAKKNRMDLTPGFGESLDAAQTIMDGGQLSQGAYDMLTVRAIRNSGAPATVVSQGKEAVFQNFAEASQRLDQAQTGALPGYGLSAADMARQEAEINNGAMELDAANYSSGSVLASEHSFDVINARAGVVRNAATRNAATDAGQARIFGAPPGTPPPPPSDRRLKRRISAIGTQNGIQLYRFQYLWSDQEYVGVMAQDLLYTHPDAVVTGQDGFYRVRYDMLDITFQTYEDWLHAQNLLQTA